MAKKSSLTKQAKYQRQFDKTKKNKEKNIAKMKTLNPNWPNKKGK